MTPETQGFQAFSMGSFIGLAETPTLSRGSSPRAGPHSPRGAALHCTVTACLVLTRQLNSVPPLLSPFFPPLSSSSVSIFPSTIFFPRIPFDLVLSVATSTTTTTTTSFSPTVSLWYIRVYIVKCIISLVVATVKNFSILFGAAGWGQAVGWK